MGAPKGSKNRTKNLPWADAIRRALARQNKTFDGGLNKVADQLVAAGLKGDPWALKEIGDRIDGKPHQQMTIAGDPDSPLTVEIVRFGKG